MRSNPCKTTRNKRKFVRLLAVCLLALVAAAMTPYLVSARPAPANVIRVAFASPDLGTGVSRAELVCGSGFSVGGTSGDGRSFAGRSSLAGGTVFVVPAGGGVSVQASNGEVLASSGAGEALSLRSAGGNLTLRCGGKEYVCPGFLEFRAVGGALQVVNAVERETYVKCVMSTEIGSAASRETRRAFSVLIRTVPMGQKHASNGFDVCATTCCQVYRGIFRRDAENDAIVDSTAGEYVTYEGAPIHCLYHGGNGGASCSSVAAWGGPEIPYLKSVSLPEDADNASEVWRYEFTQSELFDFLSSRSKFHGIRGGVESVRIEETDPEGSGYVTLLSVTDGDDNVFEVATSEKIRTALRFKSANFTVSYSMDAAVAVAGGAVEQVAVTQYVGADGETHAFESFADCPVAGADAVADVDRIAFDGVGTGHGVGFSAVGAEQLVEQGYSYKYLLQFYFPGTKISKLA